MTQRPGVRVVKLGSVPIYLQPSWFVLMAVIIGGYGIYLGRLPGVTYVSAFTVSTTVAFLIALGVFIHEVAHAVCGIARGLSVEYISMTLWGGLTKLSPGTPVTSLLVSLAGPVANALYAVGLGFVAGMFDDSPAQFGVRLAAGANLLISIFNMLPSYPLDGGHSLEAVVTVVSKRRFFGALVTAFVGLSLIPLMLIVAFYYAGRLTVTGLAAIFLMCYYIFAASYPVIKALKNQRSGGDPLAAANLMSPAVFLDETATLAEYRKYWNAELPAAATPVVLTRDGKALGWVSRETLRYLQDHEPDSTPLSRYLYPLAPTELPVHLLRIDLMDYFNGYRYQQLPQAMRTGYTPIAWVVGEAENYRGIITHRAIDRALAAEQNN